MEFQHLLNKLRTEKKLSQSKLAEKLGVSHQAVQKWESGETTPDVEKLVKIANFFGVTLDFLLFGTSARAAEERMKTAPIYPAYNEMHNWELYSESLKTEYQQSTEEGLDIDTYKDVFDSISALPRGIHKTALANALFDVIHTAGQCGGYPYFEPSEYEAICKERNGWSLPCEPIRSDALKEKIEGAWFGRICGCLLGKPIEGIRTNELIPLLKETNNYPLNRYLLNADMTDSVCGKYNFPLANRCYADNIACAPADDDTNYTVLYQKIIDDYGRDFTPSNVADAWMYYQPKNAYCTAERVAFRNFVAGYRPPQSAIYQNPYREWIGAQIRADYFGYINPGNWEAAAEMAWRDACISHTKNGIYGEMFVAAMLAAAAVLDDIAQIIQAGLSQIPAQSRLYHAVLHIMEMYNSGVSQSDCFHDIHQRWDEHSGHDWCHTISNAEIVVASLLYGNNDYARSICMAVETGFDTDCNGATVGSVLGMKNGIRSIGKEWIAPVNGKLSTAIFGIDTIDIAVLIEKTMQHIAQA